MFANSAGVGRTGVFITLSIVLERMRYEGVVDIFQTVKMLRTQRPATVQTEVSHLLLQFLLPTLQVMSLPLPSSDVMSLFLLAPPPPPTRTSTSSVTGPVWNTWEASITMQHKPNGRLSRHIPPSALFLGSVQPEWMHLVCDVSEDFFFVVATCGEKQDFARNSTSTWAIATNLTRVFSFHLQPKTHPMVAPKKHRSDPEYFIRCWFLNCCSASASTQIALHCLDAELSPHPPPV